MSKAGTSRKTKRKAESAALPPPPPPPPSSDQTGALADILQEMKKISGRQETIMESQLALSRRVSFLESANPARAASNHSLPSTSRGPDTATTPPSASSTIELVDDSSLPTVEVNRQEDVNLESTSSQPLGKPGNEASVPLGLFLRESVKSAIKEWRYVDFKTMLDDEQPAASLELVTRKGETVVVDRLASPQSKKLIGYNTWTRAWNTYVAVATELHEERGLAAKMLKHFEVVQNLRMAGKSWRFYDERFRKLLERGWASWGSTHEGTLSEARAAQDEDLPASPVASGSKMVQSQKVAEVPRAEYPNGVCYEHHESSSCKWNWKQCRYSHICFNGTCGGFHPFHMCPKLVAVRPFRAIRNQIRQKSQRGHKGKQYRH